MNPSISWFGQASMKENKENKIKNCDEISKLIKAFPKDIAALDKRSVLAKVNSQGMVTCIRLLIAVKNII